MPTRRRKTKTCKSCNESKPRAEMHLDKLGRLTRLCELCFAHITYEEERAKLVDWSWEHSLFEEQVHRSRQLGQYIPASLTPVTIKALAVERGYRCALTGKPLAIPPVVKKTQSYTKNLRASQMNKDQRASAPDLIAIDGSRPMGRDNVALVCRGEAERARKHGGMLKYLEYCKAIATNAIVPDEAQIREIILKEELALRGSAQ